MKRHILKAFQMFKVNLVDFLLYFTQHKNVQ